MWLHNPEKSDKSVNLNKSVLQDDLLMSEQIRPDAVSLTEVGQTVPGNDNTARASRKQDSTEKRVHFNDPRYTQPSRPTQLDSTPDRSSIKLDPAPKHTNNPNDDITSAYVTGKQENMQYRVREGVYLPVVRALVNGKHLALIGLDSMSSNTLCSEKFARIAGLSKGPMLNSMHMATAMGSLELKNNDTVSMTLEDVDKTGKVSLQNVPTLPIPIVINKGKNDVDHYEHLRDLEFSVPEKVSEIDILIGVDHSDIMCPLQVFKGKTGEPYATLTMFGTVLHGKKTDLSQAKSVNIDTIGESVSASALVTTILPVKNHTIDLQEITGKLPSAPIVIPSHGSDYVSSEKLILQTQVSESKGKVEAQVSMKPNERAIICDESTSKLSHLIPQLKADPVTPDQTGVIKEARHNAKPSSFDLLNSSDGMSHPDPTLTIFANDSSPHSTLQAFGSHMSSMSGNDSTCTPVYDENPIIRLCHDSAFSDQAAHTAFNCLSSLSVPNEISFSVGGRTGYYPVVMVNNKQPPDVAGPVNELYTRYNSMIQLNDNHPPDQVHPPTLSSVTHSEIMLDNG